MTAALPLPADPTRYSVPPATAELARFATSLAFSDIPADVVAIAREQAVATIGSCLAGNHMAAMHSMADGMGILGGGEVATVFGRAERVPAPTAALYNAGAAQVIEWDDWVIISHSGGAVIPTAFAAGEQARVSGKEVLAAIVIGDEVNARTSRAMQRGAYVGNSMPNHQIETALMAARLFGCDETATRCAVGLSAFLAMENCPIGWTSDSKVLVNGLPALWGIVSASLAKAGLRANQEIIEHPAGFMSTVSEEVDADELVSGLGSDWHTRTLNTKRHPSCAYNLPAIECAIALHERIPGFDPARVERIVVYGPGVTAYVAARYQAVEPSLYEVVRQGLYSHVPLCFDAGFATVASLVDGELTWRQYQNEHIFAPEIQRLAGRVVFRTDAEMHGAYYSDYQYGARVVLTMDDGREFVEERRQLLGARDRPFDHADKFREGAEGILSPAQTEEALAALRALEGVDDVREVAALLRPR